MSKNIFICVFIEYTHYLHKIWTSRFVLEFVEFKISILLSTIIYAQLKGAKSRLWQADVLLLILDVCDINYKIKQEWTFRVQTLVLKVRNWHDDTRYKLF